MHKVAITAKRSNLNEQKGSLKKVYQVLSKLKKEVYLEKAIAELIGEKDYLLFNRGKTSVDLIIVLGGDGTTLSVVRTLKKEGARVFGINTGNLGFLSEIQPSKIEESLKKVFKGSYKIDERTTLAIDIVRNKKRVKSFQALNEIVIAQSALARIINLPTKVNGKKLTNYHADGLIVATPTGSTAYSLSAGGPIVHPSLNTVIITPICPHSFTQKPIMIPNDQKIEISITDPQQKITLSIDGQTHYALKEGDTVKITKGQNIPFIRLPNENFFRTLRQKLDWGKKLEK